MTSPLRKAAALLSSLDPRTAGELLQRLTPEEADAIRELMQDTIGFDEPERRRAIVDFLATSDCGADFSEAPLLRVSPAELASALASEPADAVAQILADLPAEHAIAALGALKEPQQSEVIEILARLDHSPGPAGGVESAPRGTDSRFRASADSLWRPRELSDSPFGSPNSVSSLASSAHRGVSQPASLEELSDEALSEALSAADPEVVVLALSGAGPELHARAQRFLPAREARLVRQALHNLGAVRLSDIERAQRALLELGARLAHRGHPLGERLSLTA